MVDNFTATRKQIDKLCADVEVQAGSKVYWFKADEKGAIAGGIVNCVVGYKFTYHADDVSKRAVMVKFILVWVGSLVLNTWGTDACYYLLQKWHWLESIGFKPDGYFAAARLAVSLAVSLAWNFVLQRNFVFRPNRFDPVAIKIVDFFRPKLHKH